MTLRKGSVLIRLLFVVAISLSDMVIAQRTEPVYDSDMNVRSFEEMSYPPIAREARIEGIVVIAARLDSAGGVTSTSAISGAKLLIPDTLSNAKKWRFTPNKSGLAIIIYEFRFADGKCNHETSHLFTFREPNRVSIVACEETWQPEQSGRP